ncbi:MAG: hypothetical protein IJH80_05920 [Ruminococcus sp.]|nr:hypothetical protein [Ruminococcus sp.]
MTTNDNNIGSAKVKTKKSGIIAAACAVLVLGGGLTFYAMQGGGKAEIKTSPMAQPGVSSEQDYGETGKTDDSSKTLEPDAPVSGSTEYLTTSPATVIEPADKGTIVEGFEGYDIEVKYLLEDLWKGLDGYAQHSYGVVIDVSAKDGYELPWADEAQKKFSHFGEVWIDNGSLGFFTSLNADSVLSYGYKTQNENGEDVLRFVIAAEVPEDYELESDTEISFDVTTVFWGVGDVIKTEGSFTATETFDEARTLDAALEIPYEIITDEPIEKLSATDSETEETAVTTATAAEADVDENGDVEEPDIPSADMGIGLVTNDSGRITEGFEGLDIEVSELWYVPEEDIYGVAFNVRKTDGSPLDWTFEDAPYFIYGDLEPFMQAANAESVDMTGGWAADNDPNTMRFLLSSTPKSSGAAAIEGKEIPISIVGIAIDGKEVAKGNFEASIRYDLSKEIR